MGAPRAPRGPKIVCLGGWVEVKGGKECGGVVRQYLGAQG